ncbi:hypothetical protein Syun_023040 [Stephania yunnanensis]|uniref:Leucine-rich repeat-containing N-terminal plant-type domain-containing protein n=1 Tax=Stephania yunnanensis TaxID=152371 RepID=A0AAP0F8V4_9MAGN
MGHKQPPPLFHDFLQHVLLLLFLSLILLFPHLQMHHFASCNTTSGEHVGCLDIEKEALVDLKQGFTDPYGRLSSWQGQDCCKWKGVECNNQTGHVIKLDLRNPENSYRFGTPDNFYMIGGEISPSLHQLKHLQYLDLSINDFDGKNIPKFIGSLRHLRYLDLSSSRFSGTIPPHLGNLSSLSYLNLGYNYGSPRLMVDSLHWLSGLPSLTYLNMDTVNLTITYDWLDHVNMLPNLQKLYLGGCELNHLPSSLSFVNFTSLLVLDLPGNNFYTSIPQWLADLPKLLTLDIEKSYIQGFISDALGTLSSLQYLDLSMNQIDGKIPRSLGNLCNLKELSLPGNNISGEISDFFDELSKCPNNSLESLLLDENQITGSLPFSLGSATNLRTFRVRKNRMNGTIAESMGKLSQLDRLDLSSNFFKDVVTESHFANLTKLTFLDLSSTSEKSLVLHVNSKWIPSFNDNLRALKLSNCQVGPSFPSWIRTLRNIYSISLKNSGISDALPDWFGELSGLSDLDISFNQIKGRIPFEYRLNQSDSFSLPQFPSLSTLFVTRNKLSGSIPSNIGRLMPKLLVFDLSMNKINGSIPSSICELTQLRVLVLSDNELAGELPQWCWKYLQQLTYVDLGYNLLTGKLPSSLILLSSLQILKLSNNKFYGELPSSFENPTKLQSMDLGENGLAGIVPSWIGSGFPLLKVLGLHSNRFTGEIPSQLCSLSRLQVLDLGQNELQGSIPRCFGNFNAMAMVQRDIDTIGLSWIGVYSSYSLAVSVTLSKGRELNFTNNLRLLKSVDLSYNDLSGDIPQELTKLVGLNILNLSMNHLEGTIPEKIGNLEKLEALDLSQNQLTGPIPQSITSLSFLNHLNLSFNDLKGRIPSGNQLNSLYNPSIYEGNPELCGPPLENKCETNETAERELTTPRNKDEDDKVWIASFFASMGVGFVIGFWGLFGILVVKKSWRHSYFQFIDGIIDRVYVFFAMKITQMQG